MTKKTPESAIKISLLASIVLGMTKLFVGYTTGSLAILVSAVDSIFDFFSSAGNFWAARKSRAQPTTFFPYGFGKIEGIFSLFQGMVVTGSGLIFAVAGVFRILFGGEVEYLPIAEMVMVFSIFVTGSLVFFLRKNRGNSLILEAEISHYSSDFLSNFAILAGIFAMQLSGKIWIDGLISAVIGSVIFFSGGKIFLKSIFSLLDQQAELEYKIVEKIFRKNIASGIITNFHFLRVRRSGERVFVEAHLVFTSKISLNNAHDRADKIENEVLEKIENGDVIFHLDPIDDSKKIAKS